MIRQAIEHWDGKAGVARYEWRKIDKLPHIHFHLYPGDAMAQVLVDWAGAGLVVALKGSNMTYRFSVSEWAEAIEILEHYVKRRVAPGGE